MRIEGVARKEMNNRFIMKFSSSKNKHLILSLIYVSADYNIFDYAIQ
jgi:hypothetical protein